VAWNQVSGPSLAQFSNPNAATTTVSFNNVAGTYVLRLNASDGALTGSDDVVVTVIAPNQAPVTNAGPDQTIFLPNAAQLNGSVTDDGLPAGGTLSRAWSKVSGPGTVSFSNPNQAITMASFSAAGVYTLRLTANDSQLTSSDDVVVTVNPSPGPPPVVAITSPADGAEITTRTDVSGTVGFSTPTGTWRLEYSLNSADGVGAQNWVQFASGSSAVSNAFLGKFDPTLLLNGVYAIRLTAIDASGQAVATSLTVLVTGNQKVGHFTLSFNDLAVPLPGLPLQVLRTYDSRDKRVGDFGVGWRLSVSNVRVEKTAVMGQNWEETSTGGNFPTYSLQPTKPKKVMVTFPDGKVYKFQAVSNPQTQQLVPIQSGTVSFVQIPGTTGTAGATLEAVSNNAFQVDGAVPGVINLIDTQTIDVYNPTRFRLRTAEGFTYVVSQGQGLESVTDLNGNTLTVNASGYLHSAGQSVAFVRDALGRITSITDLAGHAQVYSYDANGDLVSFTDRETNTTTFSYDSTHRLKTITDPRNLQPLRNDYDADGRLISTTDAFNKTVGYVHDLDNRRETITDRLGRTTVHEYDQNGNVTKTTDAKLGVTLYSYDSRDNLLTVTNALNKTTSYTYDASDNKLTETDPLNHTTTYTYNNRRQVLTITDPRMGVTTNTYDAGSNLLSTRDAAGKLTTFTYDAFSGQRVSMTDALGGVTSYAYDRNGYLSKVTDPLGNLTSLVNDAQGNVLSRSVTRTKADGTSETITTSYEYDRQNRLTKTIAPDTSFTRTVYNSIGQVAENYDQLNRKTSYEYDEMGRVTKTTFPDTTFESSTYDAEGRRLTSTDRASHTTSYEYDELGRLTKTTYADTSFTTTVYDAIGRVTSVKDARGNQTKYDYDDANRRTKVTDARLKVTTFAYDANGNQQAMTDALNHTTTYEYDALNRRTKTVFHDTTFSLTGYDDLGRTVSKTDQAGKTTQYEYDKLGRLVKVTDALNQVTRYSYDEVGNQLTQTDANTHTTSYEYDALGRRVKRRLPGGQVESYSYNLTGTLTSRTDFNGKTTSYSYDALNRLLAKTPDASLSQPTVGFTYNALGQRLTMVDSSGTTTYGYDNRNRLTSQATPQGTLTYSYDAAGNLQTVRSSNQNGVTVDYSYDEVNRLQTVKDNNLAAGSNTTSYAYDDVGNLAGYTYPNGVATAYTYNSLNRLTNLTLSKTATLASFAYTLGNAGNRLSVTEQSGRKVDYTYDALYRLTSETISNDPNATGNGVLSYSYDPVGNRLSRTSSVAAAPSTTSTFEANDRLTTDAYDANGNTTGSNGNTYQYDFENRLVKLNGGTVSYVYDGDGHRVSKTVGGVTTKYLVDSNNPTGYAQVVEEVVGGSVQRVYTYGLMRVSQRQLISGNWTASFYGYDGHGSVRLLTSAAGSITDTYTYDAFGNLISRTGATLNDYLYAGEQFDSSLGFYYNRARYLRVDIGRLLTFDTYEGCRCEPQTLHKYQYANGDPANKVDPTGNSSVAELTTTDLIRNSLSNLYTGLKVLAVVGVVGCALEGALSIAPGELNLNLPSEAGPCQFNRMRVQFQRSRNGNTEDTFAFLVYNKPDPGVTTFQIRKAMEAIFISYQLKNTKLGGLTESPENLLFSAIVTLSERLKAFPLAGGTDSRAYTVDKETWDFRKYEYRVEIENKYGKNLLR